VSAAIGAIGPQAARRAGRMGMLWPPVHAEDLAVLSMGLASGAWPRPKRG